MFNTLYSRRHPLPSTDHISRALSVDEPLSGFDAALQFTIGYGVPGYGVEGGEADNPYDPGGFTWRGITLTTFRSWRGDPNATPTQLLQMTEGEIVSLYGCLYWNSVCGNQLPPALAVTVFDMSVNAGPAQAAVLVQRAAGAYSDGSIGPLTLAAVAAAPSVSFLVGRYTQLRHNFYASLASYDLFGPGWDARADGCETAAMALLPPTGA